MSDYTISVLIDGKDQLSSAAKSAEGALGGLGKIASGVLTVGLGAAVAGIGALGAVLGTSIKAAMDAENITAELNAVLKSTGGVSGMTADSVNSLAMALSKVTRFEDDAIVAGESTLLTFTKIGKDVFPMATEAMLNMAQKFGGIDAAAMQLGKALNDPIAGVSTLRRVGVMLTDTQEKQIKKFVALGDVASAQKVILGELETEFGGLARAAGDTLAGKMDILKNRIGNVQEAIGGALLPIITEFLDKAILPLLPAVERLGEVFSNLFHDLSSGVDPFTAIQRMMFDLLPPTLAADVMRIVSAIGELFKAFQTGDFQPFIDKLSRLASDFWIWLTGPGGVISQVGVQIGNIFSLISSQFSANWPTISAVLSEWAVKFWDWITGPNGVLSSVATKIGELLPVLSGEFEKAWPTISAVLSEWAVKFWDWITGPNGVLPTAFTKLGTILDEIKKWAESDLTKNSLAEFGSNAGGILVKGIVATGDAAETRTKISELFTSLLTLLKQLIETHQAIFGNLGTSIASGIIDGIVETIKTEGPARVGQALLDMAGPVFLLGAFSTKGKENLTAVGKGLMEGLSGGITDNTYLATDAVEYTGTQLEDMLRESTASHSPSAVFAKIGADMIAGLAEGWETASTIIIPSLLDSLGILLPLAIQALTESLTLVLLPALQAVWGFIQNSIMPLFRALIDLYLVALKKEVELLSGIWKGVLLPALLAVWQFIQDNIIPIFKLVIEVWLAGMKQGLSDLAAVWTDVLKPAFEKAAAFIRDVFGPVMIWVKENCIDPFLGALQFIAVAIDGIIEAIEELKRKLQSIRLPESLTGNSPSPIELAFLGVGDAVRQLARVELPRLQVEFGRTGEAAGASNIYNYNLYVTTASPVENITGDFYMMQAQAGV